MRPAVTSDSGDAAVVKPTPKKDTVRIEVPAAQRPAPQATVKLQQTQPLIRPPAAEVRTLVPAAAAPHAATAEGESVAEDPMMMYASIAVLVFAIVTLVVQALTYFAP